MMLSVHDRVAMSEKSHRLGLQITPAPDWINKFAHTRPMTHRVAVSVVIPFFNRSNTIKRALGEASLLKVTQTGNASLWTTEALKKNDPISFGSSMNLVTNASVLHT